MKMSVLHSYLLGSDLYTREYFLQDDVCRLCWTKNACTEIITKSSDNFVDMKSQLLLKIHDCLGINISAENYADYPTKLCQSCFTKLEHFSEFKNFCLENDRKLHEICIKSDYDMSTSPTPVKSEKIDVLYNPNLTKDDSFNNLFDSIPSPSSDLKRIQEKPSGKKKPTGFSGCKQKKGCLKCNICRTVFEDESAFIEHNSKEHGIETNGEYKCFGCPKKFKNTTSRRAHELNFCKGLKEGYKCKICKKFLPKRRSYEAHMRDHKANKIVEVPENIFKCKKCLGNFKTKDLLKVHIETHKMNKSNYVCETCGRMFTRRDYLLKHMVTHTGFKGHECKLCDFKSTQRSSIIIHMRKHTGDRPYSCDLCPQRCVSSSNLRAHRRRHLQLNQQFQCAICPKKFGYKSSLEEHIESIHERSHPYPCPHCGTIYTRKRGLRRHIQAKHGPGVKKRTKKISIQEVSNKEKNVVAEQEEIEIENGNCNVDKLEPFAFQNSNSLNTVQVDSYSISKSVISNDEVPYLKSIQGVLYANIDSLPEKTPPTDSKDIYVKNCENVEFVCLKNPSKVM